MYRCKLNAYRIRRQANKHKRLLLCASCFIITWIALNETFAVKLIFEQECIESSKEKWITCLSSTLERWAHALSNKDAIRLYLDINSRCPKIRRVGHWQDGGWDVCVSDLPEDTSCIVYSFGINDDPSFDQNLVTRWPHCTVYAFDPSIGRKTGDTFLGNGIHFYNIGLGGHNYVSDRGWDMLELQSIMEMLGHEHIDLLKMDIEYSEWAVFRNLKEGKVLDHIDQMLAELHFFSASGNVENFQMLKWLREQGFDVFTRRENFRFGSLIDLSSADNDSVRSYNCLEVGWRRHRTSTGGALGGDDVNTPPFDLEK